MIQLKVYDSPAKETQYWLDLYESEPIKLTLSIEDITNADATSTFSRAFKVPGTRKNAEFFKNSFDVDGTLFDVTIKKPAEILVDGAEFKQGHVRLQKIFTNTEQDRYDYELLFLGETRDFSSKIGDKGLCQLVMPDLVGGVGGTAFDTQDAITSWAAYPETASLTAGLHNGNIIYPLIDHGNTYTTGGFYEGADQTMIAVHQSGGGGAAGTFVNPSSPLFYDRLKPMIRAKRIWDQIFSDAGYTYTSNFLESELFHQIYISAFGNKATVGWDNGATGSSTDSNNVCHADAFGSDIGGQILFNNISDPGGNLSVLSSTSFGAMTVYTLPATGDYEIEASCTYTGDVQNSNGSYSLVDARISLYNMSTSPPTLLHASNYGQNTLQFSYTLNVPTDAATNQKIGLVVEPLYGVDRTSVTNVQFDVLSAPGQFNPVSSLDCTYKQIDFVKDILTAFRLVLAPDPNNPLNFIIEPWQQYINSGELYDWSHKLVESKEVVSEPVFFTQSDVIDFKFQPGGDYTNIYHQQAFSEPYGWLQFDSNNDLLKGQREIKLNGIAPTEITQTHGVVTGGTFIIPQLHTHNPEDAITQHLPIKPKTRMLFYNGKQSIPNSQYHWYLDDGGTALHLDYYPLVSPYQEWPIQPNTLNLNWANDVQYWGTVAGYNQKGSTLYTDYWSRYIESLYNTYSRRVTAYFVLNNIDLNTFSFDDTIFVNGTYYRPERIVDVEVGDYTEVQVQLLTANDYRPIIIPNQVLDNVTVTVVPPGCFNRSGSINVTTNGTPPFTWTLSNGMTGIANAGAPPGFPSYSFTISNVSPGTYTLDLTDNVGRTYSTTVFMPQGSGTLPSATQLISPASDCIAPCNGAVEITPSGGVPPYSLYWYATSSYEPITGLSILKTGLCPGDYSYYIEDANGCMSASYLVTIECAPAGGTVWNYSQNFNCEAQSPNFVKVFVPNGTTPQPYVDFVSLIAAPGSELPNPTGCFTPIAETTGTFDYDINAYFVDCESCQGIQTFRSRRVENCLVPGDYKYIDYDPNWPIEGATIKAYHPDNTCYTVQGGDAVNYPNLPWAADYPNCENCINNVGKDYLIEDCETGLSYDAAKTYAFNVGDVVQYTINADPSVIRCGTIVSDVEPLGNQTATLYSAIAYSCDDTLHCNIPNPGQTPCLEYSVTNNDTESVLTVIYTTCQGIETAWQVSPSTSALICSQTVPYRIAGSDNYTVSATGAGCL